MRWSSVQTVSVALATLLGCGGDNGGTDDLASETGESGDGDGDGESGDGDGDTNDTESDETGDPDSPCRWVWETTQMSTNGTTHAAYGVAVDPAGNFVAVGKVENADDDAWVAMYDPAGQLLWEQVIDSGVGNDYAASATFDDAGDVVLVGSMAATNKNLWIEKRNASDGALGWTVTEPPGFDGDNVPGDIELAPNGSIIVSATVRAGDTDSDIWVRSLSASDGGEVWTSTFSGVADGGGFSIDRAGDLGIGSDGSVYVGGEEGVDAMTKEGVLLRFGADGGAEQWRLAPREDGNDHLHEVVAVTSGPDGEAYFVVTQASDGEFWLYRATDGGTVEWELGLADFEYPPTTGWVVSGLAFASDGQLTIGGRFTNEETGRAISWSEVWIANVSPDGAGTCIASHTWQNAHIIPASTLGYGLAEGPNGAVAVGEIVDGPENYLWVGGFL